MADIHEVMDEMLELDALQLPGDISNRLKYILGIVKICLKHNMNVYGEYNVREKVRDKFEDRETIPYPQTVEDYEKIVQERESLKDKESSKDFLENGILFFDMMDNYKKISWARYREMWRYNEQRTKSDKV